MAIEYRRAGNVVGVEKVEQDRGSVAVQANSSKDAPQGNRVD